MRIDDSTRYDFARRGFQFRLLLGFAAALMVFISQTAVGQGYQVTRVVVPGSGTSTAPFGVNKIQYVVGSYQDSSKNTVGFLDKAGKYTSLKGPTSAAGTFARANGINDSNVVVGDFFGTDNFYHGFTYTAGVYKQYDVDSGVVSTSLFGINSLGHLVGSWVPTNTLVEEGFIDVGGTRTSFYGNGTDPTYAYAINKIDDVVGVYYDSSNNPHGFHRVAATGIITEIKYPGATQTLCYGINDAGVISGTYTNTAGNTYGFTYSKGSYASTDFAGTKGISSNGAYTGFYWGVDGAASGYVASPHTFTLTHVTITNSKQGEFWDINNNGVVVGDYVDSGGTAHGMMISGGVVTNIDDSKGVSTACRSINSTNEIVGDYYDTSGNPHGFLYSGGTFSDIPGPPGAVVSDATGINDAGDISGDYWDSTTMTFHGFILKGGIYKKLDPPGTTATFGSGINAADEVTLWWHDAAGYRQSSLYNGTTFTSINVPGAADTVAFGINKTGQITFRWTDANGIIHGAVKKGTAYYVIDFPKGSSPGIHGINDLDTFVGVFIPSGKTTPQPFQGK